jgi:hypothetical protein
MPADATQLTGRRRRKGRGRAALSRTGKPGPHPVVLSRAHLDGRTRSRRQFDAIAEGIARDLGGEDHLSTVQKHLVEAFAGAALHVNDLTTHLLLGEDVDIVAHSHAISTMVRVAARIGIRRVARNVTPSLQDILSQADEEPEEREDSA